LDLRGTRLRGSGENYVMRSLVMCTAHPLLSDQTEKNEMGGACSTRGGEERCTQCFGAETWGKRPL